MTKWEYMVLEFDPYGVMGGLVDTDEIQQKLNELGKDGWELVSAFATASANSSRKMIYNLKRASQF
ncbi:MAG: DUF4177 domain-containing protein [Candidatus Marinimicrobia bacterium]|nr:DUF4177 domain-containing protein [Candidatus Neomarinimicrobiota bacterium]